MNVRVERPMPPRLEASMRTVDAGGVRWAVGEFGQGPTMLMLHGTGASSHSFGALAETLSTRYTVVVPDLPGHARSSRPAAAGMTIDGMAASIDALLAVLGRRPTMAVGHSAGFAILARMVLDGRLPLQALIGLNAALVPFDGMLRLLSPMAKLMTLAPGLPRLVSGLARDPRAVQRLVDGTGSRIDGDSTDAYARLIRDREHVAGALAMMAAWNLERTWAGIAALRPPPLLIVGDHDLTVPPRQANDIAARVPGAQVVVLPGLGHLAHEEAPQRVAELIDAHVRSRMAQCVVVSPA